MSKFTVEEIKRDFWNFLFDMTDKYDYTVVKVYKTNDWVRIYYDKYGTIFIDVEDSDILDFLDSVKQKVVNKDFVYALYYISEGYILTDDTYYTVKYILEDFLDYMKKRIDDEDFKDYIDIVESIDEDEFADFFDLYLKKENNRCDFFERKN